MGGADQLLGDIAMEQAPPERSREVVEAGAEPVFDVRVEDHAVAALLRDHRNRLTVLAICSDIVIPEWIAVVVELGHVADVAEPGFESRPRCSRSQRAPHVVVVPDGLHLGVARGDPPSPRGVHHDAGLFERLIAKLRRQAHPSVWGSSETRSRVKPSRLPSLTSWLSASRVSGHVLYPRLM